MSCVAVCGSSGSSACAEPRTSSTLYEAVRWYFASWVLCSTCVTVKCKHFCRHSPHRQVTGSTADTLVRVGRGARAGGYLILRYCVRRRKNRTAVDGVRSPFSPFSRSSPRDRPTLLVFRSVYLSQFNLIGRRRRRRRRRCFSRLYCLSQAPCRVAGGRILTPSPNRISSSTFPPHIIVEILSLSLCLSLSHLQPADYGYNHDRGNLESACAV